MSAFRPCIVIPYFNHPLTIAPTLAGLRALQLSCWVTDDGSDERGAAAAGAAVRAEQTWVTLLRHEINLGKGAAVLSACRAASAAGHTHALQVDADGQHSLADASQLLALAKSSPRALVLGVAQYDASVPRLRLYGRYLTHFWVWINTLSLAIRDSMCGFRVYPLAPLLAVADQESIGLRMEFDTEAAVRLCWRGVPIVNVATRVIYPADGVSHFDLVGDNLRISRMHARLFFGMLWRSPRLLSRRLGAAS